MRSEPTFPKPLLVPLGDAALLIRYAGSLNDAANRAAIAAARHLQSEEPRGALEIVPGLVSVLVRYDPRVTDFITLSGEVRLALDRPNDAIAAQARSRRLPIFFDGEDLPDIASLLGLTVPAFIERHNTSPLRVLATGFAPGFVYCGLHGEDLNVPRRREVRAVVPAGTVLFAARQTAIAATPIRTGWNVVGKTPFRNFDAATDPPTVLRPGDEISFEVAR